MEKENKGFFLKTKERIEKSKIFKNLVVVYGWVMYFIIAFLIFISPESVKNREVTFKQIPEELKENVKKQKKNVTKEFRKSKKEVNEAVEKIKDKFNFREIVKSLGDYFYNIILAIYGKTITEFVFGVMKKGIEKIQGKKEEKKETESKEEKKE